MRTLHVMAPRRTPSRRRLVKTTPQVYAGGTIEERVDSDGFLSAQRLDTRHIRPLKNYQDLAGPLITPDRMALRTSAIVARPPGAVAPHSKRVAAGVQ